MNGPCRAPRISGTTPALPNEKLMSQPRRWVRALPEPPTRPVCGGLPGTLRGVLPCPRPQQTLRRSAARRWCSSPPGFDQSKPGCDEPAASRRWLGGWNLSAGGRACWALSVRPAPAPTDRNGRPSRPHPWVSVTSVSAARRYSMPAPPLRTATTATRPSRRRPADGTRPRPFFRGAAIRSDKRGNSAQRGRPCPARCRGPRMATCLLALLFFLKSPTPVCFVTGRSVIAGVGTSPKPPPLAHLL